MTFSLSSLGKALNNIISGIGNTVNNSRMLASMINPSQPGGVFGPNSMTSSLSNLKSGINTILSSPFNNPPTFYSSGKKDVVSNVGPAFTSYTGGVSQPGLGSGPTAFSYLQSPASSPGYTISGSKGSGGGGGGGGGTGSGGGAINNAPPSITNFSGMTSLIEKPTSAPVGGFSGGVVGGGGAPPPQITTSGAPASVGGVGGGTAPQPSILPPSPTLPVMTYWKI